LLAVNPAVRVPILKTHDKSARRAITLPEIKRILKACGEDAEWRGLVLFGLYLGQRLGDLAKLTWRAVNFESGEIAFTTRKTGRRIVLPLVQPLSDYLASLPASDNPNAFIFDITKSKKWVRIPLGSQRRFPAEHRNVFHFAGRGPVRMNACSNEP
jgi:integrase